MYKLKRPKTNEFAKKLQNSDLCSYVIHKRIPKSLFENIDLFRNELIIFEENPTVAVVGPMCDDYESNVYQTTIPNLVASLTSLYWAIKRNGS